MATSSQRDQSEWYTKIRSKYDALSTAAAATLRALLREENIEGVAVTHRAKELDSFKEKLKRKRYGDAQKQMTDLAGIRIIALVERDLERVETVIRKAFRVFDDDSLDKSDELGVDKFGYRSLHFICDLGPQRERLPENKGFAGLKFEIQVRSALQHAWAEIEHDRSYKFKGAIPSKLKRRLHLVAGLLELADRELSELTNELEEYTAVVRNEARHGRIELELNSTTALEVVRYWISKRGGKPNVRLDPPDQDVIGELNRFGVQSIKDLKRLFTEEFLQAAESVPNNTLLGLLREAMMYSDIHHYFRIRENSWQGWDQASVDVMIEKYGADEIHKLVADYEIRIDDEE